VAVAPGFDPFFLLPAGGSGGGGGDGGERRYLALPDATSPTLLVELSSPFRAAGAVLQWGDIHGPRDLLRHAASAAGIAAHRPRPGTPIVSVPGGGVPAILEAMPSHGVGRAAWWYVALTRGSSLRRGVFFVRLDGGRRVVVKFARARGQTGKFDREEAGLSLVAAAGGVVAARAPRSLARFDVDGYPVCVQTAAPGQDLGQLLRGPLPRAVKIRALERVVAWLLDVARTTRGEVGRYGVPTVFAHGDLADGNVMVTLRSMSVVDWERARADGVPLWDLLYFAVNTLPLLDGVAGLEQTLAYLVSLFRGEQGASSALLFRWVRSYVEAAGLPPDAVGELAGACWRDHAERVDLMRDEAAAEHAAWPLMAMLGEVWSSDPAFAVRWTLWR
jgi:hypothetical protein